MLVLELLRESPNLYLAVAGVLGLMIGSFLNVVIHRLPIMLERRWRADCAEVLQQPLESSGSQFNLITPRSRCPHCGHMIGALENIPVLSYVFLRGRCAECRARISIRYPIIEVITGLLSVAVAAHFGVTLQAIAALILTWSLIALSAIDFDHQLLPDVITLPLLWLGLLLSVFSVFAAPVASIIGAITGYLALWLVFQLFRLVTGKEGMGYGDFKLLAVLGAWLGWQSLPLVIILSSLVGALVGISLIALMGRNRNVPIPFGPYLAAAGWIALLWGHDLTALYLRWSGIAG